MEGLTAIWNDRAIKIATKVKPVKALVFPIVGLVPTVRSGDLDDEESREEES